MLKNQRKKDKTLDDYSRKIALNLEVQIQIVHQLSARDVSICTLVQKKKLPFLSVFISYCCCDRLAQIYLLKSTQVYFCDSSEGQQPTTGLQSYPPPRGSRAESVSPFFQHLGRSLLHCFVPQSLPPTSRPELQHLLPSLTLSPSYRDTCDYVGPTKIIG